eukprot:3917467-Prymnesium_polylepis.1
MGRAATPRVCSTQYSLAHHPPAMLPIMRVGRLRLHAKPAGRQRPNPSVAAACVRTGPPGRVSEKKRLEDPRRAHLLPA